VATAAMFWLALVKVGHWPPSCLLVGATSSPRTQVAVKSTIKILSALSAGSCGWAVVVACLPVSLLCLHHLTLDVGLLSAGSRSLALSKSMSSLKGEADVLPQCARPRWNHHYGLSGQIVL
jgi:hypothetical protein